MWQVASPRGDMKTRLAISVLALISMLAVPGCAGEQTAKTGDTVRVHYTGTLEDGSEFESSVGGDPLEFTLGQGEMMPGFEDAVMGMKVGESRTVTIPADEAYGPYRDELVFEVDRTELPADLEPEVGDQLYIQSGGTQIPVTVIEVSESTITIDANHSLAGKDLTFEIELVEIL